MKSNAQAKPYFSAYPLKAIPQSSQVSHENSSSVQRVGRLRVMPMVNPYPASIFDIKADEAATKNNQDPEKHPNWFNNYE